MDDAVKELFNYWKEVFSKNNKTVLDQKRRSKIVSALKNYSVEDLRAAILGCSRSEFHVHNKYTDIELILRNAPKIEFFREKGFAHLTKLKADEKRRAELLAQKAVDTESILRVYTPTSFYFNKNRRVKKKGNDDN